MKDSTRTVRCSLTRAEAGQALHRGPVFVSTFHTPGDPAPDGYSYGRSHQPTWTDLELAIGQLEVGSGEAAGVRIFGSGLAAVGAVFGALLGPGDVVVLQAGCYFGARQVLAEVFASRGIEVREVSVTQLSSEEALRGAQLVWIETPGNPGLEIVDVEEVVKAARAAGAKVAVDNTTATPYGQRPLQLGADLSVCSDSKAMCGHSDILIGHLATYDSELLRKVDRWRTLTGAAAGPMEAWLALRSLVTLPLRLERMSANALELASFLKKCRQVTDVLYPGLEDHPEHALARRQMRYFGPVLSFKLRNKAAAQEFLSRAELVTEATSFGGVTTTAERRARWGGDSLDEGFIRMSAGLEDIGDLKEDMERALHEL